MAGIAKLTIRPAEFHEVKFSGIKQDYNFKTGQFLGPPPANAGAYNLVKFYFGYEPIPDILAAFTVDN
jgi:hypothetical protein